MIAGRLVGCACDTEPDASTPTIAVRSGDTLVITGRKMYVVNGVNADLCFVTVHIDGEAATVLVEKDQPGVRVDKVLDKLGTRAIDSAVLEFGHVRVPIAHLALPRGVAHIMHWNRVMTVARFLMCADAYFLHAITLDRIVGYAQQRTVDGRPLASWPINRRAFSHASADQALMRAGLVDCFERLEGRRNAVADVAALKSFCVDRTTRFAALCAEMHGGAGYMWDSDFLTAQAEMLGLRMAGGSVTAMKGLANQAFAVREQLEAMT
jgi:alkylation response protein AidB-like acyl-CoA dehydrogenase